MNEILNIDKSVLFFFNNTIKSIPADAVFIFFTSRMSILYIIPLPLLIFFKLKKDNDSKGIKKLMIVLILAGIGVGLSDLITSRIIKPLVGRPRPCQVIEGLYFWKSKKSIWVLTDGIRSFKSSFSFVSSHASNSMTAAVLLSYFYKNYTYVFIFASLMIGISRVYLAVHYPSDVLAAWFLGSILAVCVILAHRFLMTKYTVTRI